MEFIFEIIVEVFLEGGLNLLLSIYSPYMPEDMPLEKKKRIIAIIAVFISIALIVALIVGIILFFVSRGKSFWGWFLIALNVIYLLAIIAIKIISHFKER